MTFFRILFLVGFFFAAFDASALDVIELRQDPDIALEHQRMPGNARAQAERRGAVRSVPHLFVYHPDAARSPAFFMTGFRRGFERQLAMVLDDFRVQRSMAPLDMLLERATTEGGNRLEPADLPLRRVVVVLYRRDDCGDCDLLETQLTDWFEARTGPEAMLLRVHLP